jgi:hypothetical protein
MTFKKKYNLDCHLSTRTHKENLGNRNDELTEESDCDQTQCEESTPIKKAKHGHNTDLENMLELLRNQLAEKDRLIAEKNEMIEFMKNQVAEKDSQIRTLLDRSPVVQQVSSRTQIDEVKPRLTLEYLQKNHTNVKSFDEIVEMCKKPRCNEYIEEIDGKLSLSKNVDGDDFNVNASDSVDVSLKILKNVFDSLEFDAIPIVVNNERLHTFFLHVDGKWQQPNEEVTREHVKKLTAEIAQIQIRASDKAFDRIKSKRTRDERDVWIANTIGHLMCILDEIRLNRVLVKLTTVAPSKKHLNLS